MEIPNDLVLTRLLITCFTGIFEGLLKPLERNGPKNLTKFKYSEGDLTYLETTAGGAYRYHTDARVFLGHDGDRVQIWGMSLVAEIGQHVLASEKIPLFDLRKFLNDARTRGFILTKNAMESGQLYSLFDIPLHERDGPTPGSKIRYRETVDESLDFFGGEETIELLSRGKAIPLYRGFIQGSRL